MPTPFYHLNIATLLSSQPGYQPGIRDLLDTYRSTFLLGHVAPDVQVISGQTRENTHFYKLPTLDNDLPPWERMLSTYPSFDCIEDCDFELAVFVAGYICHLQADWLWVRQIYEPYFVSGSHWQTFSEREYMHNVLRSYLDIRVLESLKSGTYLGLAQSNPKAWLSFVAVDHLEAWRDFLVNQLKPGAPIQTVEVFASRQGISAKKYYRLLNEEDEMQQQIFYFVPMHQIEAYCLELLAKNVNLLNECLGKVGGNGNANT